MLSSAECHLTAGAGTYNQVVSLVALGIPDQIREMAPMRIPLGRAATPEEAAGGIMLMASLLALYITNHTLEVTGGAGM